MTAAARWPRQFLKLKLLPVILLPVLMSACGGVPDNVVVLLPDEKGEVGVVEVSNADGTRRLSKANEAVALRGPSRPPGEVFTMQQNDVDKVFRRAIAAQPEPPERFILYFETDTTRLTPYSEQQLPKILEVIRRRTAPEVDVGGHTDTAGSREYNVRLARDRAEAVRDAIIDIGVDPGHITVTSFGESNPLIPTPDGVPEPRNRRVEAVVR